ncbi:PadR family transcriptional regulator [Knoellia sinensis KCTC 19936]|uniref:PadR family transcriptional regulator n=1 Tax=Knoellia sinensis KCTC 19936 TaxID=1385520 RepID=A0A0A0J8S4_9MICO|nr:PadR family transcriptional regulator [Knoellia sinensis]KGN33169.1 PadR family transcriptional regulator [Knoellia sinensis KCTC 19936]
MPPHDPQMLKGVLGLLLLSMLSTGENYGYGIVTQLRAVGFDDLAEGTVYPGLTRLEAAGLLESHLVRSDSGPARKYYRLTSAGRAELTLRRAAWDGLVASVETATSDLTSDATTHAAPAAEHTTGDPA